ncbi:MAG: hypothetical protein QOE14_575 [Humisphaera sp.]|nr:hypothetical protein [Humisphaera sp.]
MTTTSAIEHQLSCPLCDYDLRGQVEPRCPECGYTFVWQDLRDPARRKHKYLFEHHPERNLRSFIRTMIGHLMPRRFWGGLLPSQPSHPKRLMAYALVIVLTALLPTIAITARVMYHVWSYQASSRRTMAMAMTVPLQHSYYKAQFPGLTPQQIIDAHAPAPTFIGVLTHPRVRRDFASTAAGHSIGAIWATCSLAALMIFRISMRRARLRSVHFVRCVVYTADVIVWGNVALALLVGATILAEITLRAPFMRFDPDDGYRVATTIVVVLFILTFIYRLMVAFKKYLHFHRPILTVLAAQFIVALAALNVLLNI